MAELSFLDGISTVFAIILSTLSAAASLVLVNLNFRFLYKMPSTDVAFSAPFTRTQHFVGRLAATLTSLFVIYIGNAIATAGILFAWKEHAIIWQYLPLYAITLLSSCVLAPFQLSFMAFPAVSLTRTFSALLSKRHGRFLLRSCCSL